MRAKKHAMLLGVPALFVVATSWADPKPARFDFRELSAVAAWAQRHEPLSIVEMKIERFELSEGIEGIGGASMQDAVNKLRNLVKVPLCLEEIKYELPRDALMLGAALKRLEALRQQGPLSEPDQARWNRYQGLVKKENPATFVVGIDVKIFRLPERNAVTVRAILDELMQLDPAYTWKVVGARGKEIIVIQPRAGSVLGWRVDPICEVRIVPEVYKGKFGTILSERKIVFVQFELLPNVTIDLCRKGLTAEYVLNLTAQAAGSNFSWSLTGTQDNRFLTFSR